MELIKKEGKRSGVKIIVVLSLALVAALAVWQLLHRQLQPVDPDDARVIEVRLPDDGTASDVAALLSQHGLIRSERLFLAYCRQQGLDKQLQAGLYEFSRSMSLPQMAAQVAAGRVKSTTMTVPEGYTVKQIGEMLAKNRVCTQEQWAQALANVGAHDFLPPVDVSPERRLEGFLYPDTYRIDESSRAEDVVAMMLANFSAVWKEQFAAQAEQKNLSVMDTVIVASLIEREARVPEERERIAGVIYNRLQAGMPLQIDATVIYSLGEHRERLTYKDLEIDSPYNTYRYPGLPAGPIASPGGQSIAAALAPEDNDYLYYVAKGDGSHHFSVTYAEHLAAKARYGL